MAAITGRRITVARASRPPPPDLKFHHPLSKTSSTSWPIKTVADILIDRTGGQTKIPRSEYLDSGAFPVIGQGREFSSGFTNSESQLYKGGLPIVLFGDHTREVKFISEPFALGTDGVKALQPKPGLEAKYLYYYLLRSPVSPRGYSRHYKFLKEKEIPLPPLPEQHRIVEILDQADALRRQRREADALSQRILPALFQEMFGDPQIETIKAGKHLGDYIVQSNYGLSAKAHENATGIPILRMNTARKAIGMANINSKEIAAFPIWKPRMERQLKFREVLGGIDEFRRTKATSTATLETLFQTLLHRAFDGSLTAAWREGQSKEVLQ